MYFVFLSQDAQRFLRKLDHHISTRIQERLKRLGDEQHPSDAKFLYRDGSDKVFRYRIGEFRALYKVKDRDRIVLVAKVDKRPRVYS